MVARRRGVRPGMVLGSPGGRRRGLAHAEAAHLGLYRRPKEHFLLEVFQDRKFNFIRASYSVKRPDHGHLGRFEKNYL